MRVLLQAGHYPNAGGAPGEAAWTYDLAQRLAARLRARGVETVLIGAWALDNSNAPAVVTREDWDLFVSLHYDADIYAMRTGCFAGRAAGDPVGAESDRALAAWKAVYPTLVGIPLHEERMNPNVTDYYAFRATSAKTPGILIEHGVGQGLDHAKLFTGIDIVADADAAAILAYLGVPPAVEAPAVPISIPPAAITKPEEMNVAMLTDQELDRICAVLWGTTHKYNPALAIDRAWREEWKAGHYRGKPSTLERPLPNRPAGDDGAYRVFAGGVCVYRYGKVSWNG